MSGGALRDALAIELPADVVLAGDVAFSWGERAWCTRFPAGSFYASAVVRKIGSLAFRPVPVGVRALIGLADLAPCDRRVHRRALELGVMNGAVEAIAIAGVLVPRRYVGVAVGHAQRTDELWLRVGRAEVGDLECAVVRGADWVVLFAPVAGEMDWNSSDADGRAERTVGDGKA